MKSSPGSGLLSEPAVGPGDGARLSLALLCGLSLTGTFEAGDGGTALDGDSVGVEDVEPDLLASALRAENDLIRCDKPHHKLTIAVETKIAAKNFTSNTPNTGFLQFLLRLAVRTDLGNELASALVSHPYGDQLR